MRNATLFLFLISGLVLSLPTGAAVAQVSATTPCAPAHVGAPRTNGAAAVEDPGAVSAYDAFRGLTAAQIETFLHEAPVVAVREIGTGTTRPLRATLDDGRIRHDAAIQSIDACEETMVADGRGREVACDSYRYNIAAYEIGKLLGLTSIPPSVEREFKGRRCAFTWWIDQALTLAEMEVRGTWQPNMEQWQRQRSTVGIFDELIFNTDRHQANLIQDPGWWVWMIDHTRAFHVGIRLRDPERLSELRMDPSLFVHLGALNQAALERCCAAYLSADERSSVLVRRDSIVARFR